MSSSQGAMNKLESCQVCSLEYVHMYCAHALMQHVLLVLILAPHLVLDCIGFLYDEQIQCGVPPPYFIVPPCR